MSLTTNSSSPLIIRQAIIDDCPLILHFIKELADYEKLLHEVVADVATLEETLFGDKQHAEVVIESDRKGHVDDQHSDKGHEGRSNGVAQRVKDGRCHHNHAPCAIADG